MCKRLNGDAVASANVQVRNDARTGYLLAKPSSLRVTEDLRHGGDLYASQGGGPVEALDARS